MKTQHQICKGEQHGNFKNSFNYNVLHKYIKARIKKPKVCEICKKKKPFDLAFKNHKAGENTPELYTRDLADWQYLCRSCHMKLDNRVSSLKPMFCSCGKRIIYNQYGTFHKLGGKACVQIIPKKR